VGRRLVSSGSPGEVFGEIRPASTAVVVAGLVDPRFLLEMEADAVVEEPGT
jgi:enamine deaminase RidA (YjgF/YER057c/UK114 family)